MHDATLLQLALTKQFGPTGSAHYNKIRDGRLCRQWPHAIVLVDNTGRSHSAGQPIILT